MPGVATPAVHAFVVAIRVAQGYTVPAHRHGVAEFLLIGGGSSEVTVGGHTSLAQAGDLVVFRPGQRHAERVLPGHYHYICLRLASSLLDALPLPDSSQLPVVSRLGSEHPLFHLGAAMAREQAEADRWTSHILQAQTTAFLAGLWRYVEGTSAVWERLLRGEACAELPHTVQALAEALNLELSALRAQCRARTGLGLKRFLTVVRLRRAQVLLRGSSRSVVAIAAELGFSNAQYLARQYRQHFGHPPSAERLP